MFRRKNTETAEAPAVMRGPTVPRPVHEIPSSPPPDYIKLCEDIGANQLSAWGKLSMILAVNVGKFYDTREVDLFLLKLCPKNMNVSWLPLCGRVVSRERWHEYSEGTVYIEKAPRYTKAVPVAALELIHTIEKEVPDTFGYYVSDYSVVRPDPFLMVRDEAANRQMVVLHWDEPRWDDRTT